MSNPDEPSLQHRRQFLRGLGAAAAGAVLSRVSTAFGEASPRSGRAKTAASSGSSDAVPTRKFGRHDVQISVIGIGGHSLAMASSEAASIRIVDEAIASGINFMDNCWDYHGGRAEEVMGKALKGKRDKVFLMTKVCTHGKGGKKEAMRMLEDSLRRLGTDHLDLWQLHAVASMDQVEHAFRPGSVIEALEEAKKQGKTRFIGFTGHTDPKVHMAMLAKRHPFDACQFPFSPIDANVDGFQRTVFPEVIKQKIAPLAMKTLLGNAAPIKDGVMTVPEALRYVLSLPVATIVSGITSVEELRENVKIAKTFTPMSEGEMLALEKKVRPVSEGGRYEPYRQWMSYRDGDSGHYV